LAGSRFIEFDDNKNLGPKNGRGVFLCFRFLLAGHFVSIQKVADVFFPGIYFQNFQDFHATCSVAVGGATLLLIGRRRAGKW
jgi:hypothetical protein